MKQRLLALAVLVLVIAATAADAQPRRPTRPYQARAGRWEFSLQTRYTASRDYNSDNGSSLSLKDSLGWGFGFGYNFNDRFNLGLGFGWRRIPYDAVAVDATDPDNAARYNSELSVSTISLIGDWNILPGKITPYVCGRAGWTMIDTNILAGWGSGCWWDPWLGYVCGSVPYTYGKDTFSYGIGLGGRLELSEAFFVRVGYEYGKTDLDRFDGNHMLRIDLGLLN